MGWEGAMLRLGLGLGLPLGWVGVPRAGPLWAGVHWSPCFIPVLHPRLLGVWRGRGRRSCWGWCGPWAPCAAGTMGTWPPWDPGGGLARVPSAPRPRPLFGRVWGGPCQRLARLQGGKDQLAGAGCALTAPSPAGADASGRRSRWVPPPPVAFPCIPGEEGWESHRLSLQQLCLLPARHLAPGAAWDALPVSPSAPLPAGRRGGVGLSRQLGSTGETRNKATLGINCLPDGSRQCSGAVPFPAYSGSGSACAAAPAASGQNWLWSPVLVLAWPGGTHRGASPPPAHVLAPHLFSPRKRKTN